MPTNESCSEAPDAVPPRTTKKTARTIRDRRRPESIPRPSTRAVTTTWNVTTHQRHEPADEPQRLGESQRVLPEGSDERQDPEGRAPEDDPTIAGIRSGALPRRAEPVRLRRRRFQWTGTSLRAGAEAPQGRTAGVREGGSGEGAGRLPRRRRAARLGRGFEGRPMAPFLRSLFRGGTGAPPGRRSRRASRRHPAAPRVLDEARLLQDERWCEIDGFVTSNAPAISPAFRSPSRRSNATPSPGWVGERLENEAGRSRRARGGSASGPTSRSPRCLGCDVPGSVPAGVDCPSCDEEAG